MTRHCKLSRSRPHRMYMSNRGGIHMHLRKALPLALMVALIVSLCFGQPASTTWYSFDKQFITANYPQDSAIGSLTVNGWRASSETHRRLCSGDDGELHIGVTLQGIELAASQMPLSTPLNELDTDWGIVMELPNAAQGNGKKLLSQNANKPAKFTGYFRIWDEGHAVREAHPSNPHHIFEIHPAWAFQVGAATFNRPDLVDSIPDYRGYGATKFMPIINALNDGTWPRAYQDQNSLHVELLKSGNFFQLPIHIREVQWGVGWSCFSGQ